MTGNGGGAANANGDPLTRSIIEAIIRVRGVLGPGFVESIYRRALSIELQSRALRAETEVIVDVHCEGRPVGQHRIDILVERHVIVELKTVEALGSAH